MSHGLERCEQRPTRSGHTGDSRDPLPSLDTGVLTAQHPRPIVGILLRVLRAVLTPRQRGLVFLTAGMAICAAGCAGNSTTSATLTFLPAGQLPASAIPSGSDHGAGGLSATTIPLAQESPTTAMFTAIGAFQSCLTGLGVTFIGAPNAANPNSPANNPTYLKTLGTCAARSKIVQALQAEQSAQQDLTPAQVKTENQDYLKWRTCMIGRGWGIPTPTPNAKGLLFSFGGSGGAGGGFKPPPGQSLLSSADLQQCASKAQAGSS